MIVIIGIWFALIVVIGYHIYVKHTKKQNERRLALVKLKIVAGSANKADREWGEQWAKHRWYKNDPRFASWRTKNKHENPCTNSPIIQLTHSNQYRGRSPTVFKNFREVSIGLQDDTLAAVSCISNECEGPIPETRFVVNECGVVESIKPEDDKSDENDRV